MKWWCIVLVSVLVACGPQAGENNGASNNGASNNGGSNNGEPTTGEEVYRQPLQGGNTFTCSTCHALAEPAADGIIRPGHQIGDAFGRPTYKNGQLTELRDAVNTCVTEWMNGAAFAEDDPSWVLLRDWLEEMSPAESPALEYAIVAPPTELTGGDPDAGKELFNESCSVCHGQDAAGTNKAPGLGGLDLDPALIARRVRTSGRADSSTYDGLTGGIMPFWAADRLSDAQLLDIVAFVAAAEFVDPNNGTTNNGTGTNNGGTNNGTTGGGDCEATHPKVGQSMTFSTFAHDVEGTATIVDDCTITIEGFNYDGGGIDVQVYAGLNGDFRNGFSISEDLYRPGEPYVNETLTLTLPAGKSLDDLDGLSVWCVDVGVSFGDGTFE